MNDRCTPDTARRLKEKGFPQPDPEPGQVWYLDDTPYVVRSFPQRFNETDWIFSGLLERVQAGKESLPEAIYAPTAPDILRELGFEYELSFAADLGGYICTGNFPAIFSNENNPSEACAMAWGAKQKR